MSLLNVFSWFAATPTWLIALIQEGKLLSTVFVALWTTIDIAHLHT